MLNWVEIRRVGGGHQLGRTLIPQCAKRLIRGDQRMDPWGRFIPGEVRTPDRRASTGPKHDSSTRPLCCTSVSCLHPTSETGGRTRKVSFCRRLFRQRIRPRRGCLTRPYGDAVGPTRARYAPGMVSMPARPVSELPCAGRCVGMCARACAWELMAARLRRISCGPAVPMACWLRRQRGCRVCDGGSTVLDGPAVSDGRVAGAILARGAATFFGLASVVFLASAYTSGAIRFRHSTRHGNRWFFVQPSDSPPMRSRTESSVAALQVSSVFPLLCSPV